MPNETITVVSKHRTAYLGVQVFTIIAMIGLFFLCLYFSMDKGRIDYRNAMFTFACIILLGLIYMLYAFLARGFKQVTVSEKGIELKNLFNGKKAFVPYEEILRFSTSRVTHQQGAGRTAGYQQLVMELTNDRLLTLDAEEFENFIELRSHIYSFHKDRQEENE